MNLSLFSLFFHFALYPITEGLGSPEELIGQLRISQDWLPTTEQLAEMEQENFMSWKAPCVVCGQQLEKSEGIFCGNFLLRRGSFDPCMFAVCGVCYKQHPRDNYATQKELDKDEAWVTDERLSDRFKC